MTESIALKDKVETKASNLVVQLLYLLNFIQDFDNKYLKFIGKVVTLGQQHLNTV